MDNGNRVIKGFLWNISAGNIASLLASRMDGEVDGAYWVSSSAEASSLVLVTRHNFHFHSEQLLQIPGGGWLKVSLGQVRWQVEVEGIAGVASDY